MEFIYVSCHLAISLVSLHVTRKGNDTHANELHILSATRFAREISTLRWNAGSIFVADFISRRETLDRAGIDNYHGKKRRDS